MRRFVFFIFFFFNDTATTEIYTLSLHDALPILGLLQRNIEFRFIGELQNENFATARDRKSTRLNSSHSQISYAVFCLKKKKKKRDLIYINICIINLHVDYRTCYPPFTSCHQCCL